MHILTKILTVVVTLLVVMLVPLVMVNATNESSFKSRFEAADAAAKVASESLRNFQLARVAGEAALNAQIQALEAAGSQVRSDLETRNAEVRRLQGELTRSTAMMADMQASLAQIRQTGEANSNLTKMLLAEASDLRGREADLSKQNVELQQKVSDLQDSESVLQAANYALQEQLKDAQQQRDRDAATIARYEATVGSIHTVSAGEVRRVADRSLRAKVIKVVDDPAGRLATIDAGERDGVQSGWVLTLSDGSNYVANLRIIEVDVNRAVGVIELEDVAARGAVAAGQTATARPGE